MTLYLVCRVPCEHGGRLVQNIGVCLTEDDAVAMCSNPDDCVIELEAGRCYPAGEVIPGGVKYRLPLCATNAAWQTVGALSCNG